jgi:hypothetical protein
MLVTGPRDPPDDRTSADVTVALADVLDLLEAGWVDDPDVERASLFLLSGREEARRIGRRIHAGAGWDGMSAVHAAVGVLMGPTAAGELEAAWNGIGDWRW